MNTMRLALFCSLLGLSLGTAGEELHAQPGQPNASGTVDDLVPVDSADRDIGDVGWNTDCTMTNHHPDVILRMRVTITLKKWNLSLQVWETVDSVEGTALVDKGQTVHLADVGTSTELDVGSYLVHSKVVAEFTDDPAPGPPKQLDELTHYFVVN